MGQEEFWVICKDEATVPVLDEIRGIGGTYLEVGGRYQVKYVSFMGDYTTYYIGDKEYFGVHFEKLSDIRDKKLKKILG